MSCGSSASGLASPYHERCAGISSVELGGNLAGPPIEFHELDVPQVERLEGLRKPHAILADALDPASLLGLVQEIPHLPSVDVEPDPRGRAAGKPESHLGFTVEIVGLRYADARNELEHAHDVVGSLG